MSDQQLPELPPPYLPDAAATGPAAPGFVLPAYAPPVPKTLSLTSLVLGLVSILFGFVFVVPIVGLVFGILALKREPAGRSYSIPGIWINAVVLGLIVVGIIVIVLLVIAVRSFSSSIIDPGLGSIVDA